MRYGGASQSRDRPSVQRLESDSTVRGARGSAARIRLFRDSDAGAHHAHPAAPGLALDLEPRGHLAVGLLERGPDPRRVALAAQAHGARAADLVLVPVG